MNKLASVALTFIGGVIIWNYVCCPIIGLTVSGVNTIYAKHKLKKLIKEGKIVQAEDGTLYEVVYNEE